MAWSEQARRAAAEARRRKRKLPISRSLYAKDLRAAREDTRSLGPGKHRNIEVRRAADRVREARGSALEKWRKSGKGSWGAAEKAARSAEDRERKQRRKRYGSSTIRY